MKYVQENVVRVIVSSNLLMIYCVYDILKAVIHHDNKMIYNGQRYANLTQLIMYINIYKC